jgi:hypothetical protein
VDLTFDRAVKVNTDGEVLEASRCTYRVNPRSARFFAGDDAFALASPTLRSPAASSSGGHREADREVGGRQVAPPR